MLMRQQFVQDRAKASNDVISLQNKLESHGQLIDSGGSLNATQFAQLEMAQKSAISAELREHVQTAMSEAMADLDKRINRWQQQIADDLTSQEHEAAQRVEMLTRQLEELQVHHQEDRLPERGNVDHPLFRALELHQLEHHFHRLREIGVVRPEVLIAASRHGVLQE
eukprot:SAG31_NODE_8122_length_1518_cov_1.712474_2_plen_167_part_00